MPHNPQSPYKFQILDFKMLCGFYAYCNFKNGLSFKLAINIGKCIRLKIICIFHFNYLAIK